MPPGSNKVYKDIMDVLDDKPIIQNPFSDDPFGGRADKPKGVEDVIRDLVRMMEGKSKS